MDLKVSSPRPDISPPDDVNDPEEKEVSEDDDDDRNHKHRRRDARSQSSERDALEPVFSRPYRKWNKPYENGNPSASFNKRRPSISSFSHGPLDSTQRIRASQSMSGDLDSGRGRGREAGFWGQHELVQQGSMPSNLFAGRVVPTFGMVPTLPNGGLDSLHPLHLQGTLRQSIHPGMNMGIPRQRCRDFEERGFCLRGDMCPMEHGVNRIVVEDVQSLSQFNLPVSLPSTHLLGTATGQGPLPAVSVPPATLTSSKGLGSKSSKPGMNGDGMGLNDTLADGSVTAGADVYDPDQPLWANDGPETSGALLSLNPSTLDETGNSLDVEPSDRYHFGLSAGFGNDRPLKISGSAGRSQSSSVWGRIGSSKNRPDEKVDPVIRSSYSDNEAKEDLESLTSAHGTARHGKRMNTNDIAQQVTESSSRVKLDSGRSSRKPSQKALRTLFVNGIPHKDNKREALLLHFQKFGEVIDIYIPLNSERAFVQFSKREEAEAALKAPDAVMGNRFIKLWWANRDSIPDDGITGCSNVSMGTGGMAFSSVVPRPSVAGKVKENPHSAASKSNIPHSSSATGPASDHPKPAVADAPKAPPPSQKKMESLELLKEEIRKKQELLDQKRSEFRRQLDKLEKQSTGLKDEQTSDPTAKRHKVGPPDDFGKAENSKSTGAGTVTVPPPQAEGMAGNSRSLENAVPQGPKPSSTVAMQESTTLKPSIRPLAPVGAPFIINRFKLDNRPTAFKIIPPLPSGLANVAVLKEHFSNYGDLSTVELEKFEQGDGSKELGTSVAAQISFTTRRAAEKAFSGGKCWQGHNLQFTWLTSSSSGKDMVGRKENPSAPSKQSSDVNVQAAAEVAATVSLKDADSVTIESGDLEKSNSLPDNADQENLGSNSASVSFGKRSP